MKKLLLFLFLGTMACEKPVIIPSDLPSPQDTVEAVIVGAVGQESEENYYEFGHAASADLGPDGEVVVVDRLQNKVIIFDSTGTFIREFGRPGNGPSEFNQPIGVGVLDDGEIVVLSTSRGRRFSVFSWEGKPLKRFPVVLQGQAAPWLGVIADNRTFYDWTMRWNPNFNGDLTDLSAVAEMNTIAMVPMSLMGVSSPEKYAELPYHHPSLMMSTMPDGVKREAIHPYSFSQLWSVSPDGTWATLTQDSLALRVSNFSGETLAEFHLPTSLEETTEDDLKVARDLQLSWADGIDYEYPPTIEKLPVYSVYLDTNERLWLSSTPTVEIRMRVTAAVVDCYALDGTSSFSVQLPHGVNPYRPFFTVKGDKAIGIIEDEYGLETILVMEIPKRQ